MDPLPSIGAGVNKPRPVVYRKKKKTQTEIEKLGKLDKIRKSQSKPSWNTESNRTW